MNKTITLLIIGVIFLALLLMVLNSFKVGDRHGVPASAAEKAHSQENAPPARILEERAAPAQSAPEAASSAALVPPATKSAPQPAESDAAERGSSTAGVAVKTVPAQIDAGPPPTIPPSPPKAPATPEPSAKQTSGNTKNITSIVVYATQEGATLRLGGDHPLVYKSMLLHNPDRFVLDFEGQWNVNIPGIPPNKLVKAIRVGRQTDSTRIVVDLHRAPASSRVIKTSPQRLDVRLR